MTRAAVARPARLRLVVLGLMGRLPFGGQAWLYLNWLRAFSRLGHEVWYVEDDPSWPYDPERNGLTDDCRHAVRHVRACLAGIGLEDRWAYRLAGTDRCFGLSPRALDDLYRGCDALLNVCGGTDLREEHLAAPLRIYVQTDPVTSELRLAGGDAHTRQAFAAHQLFFTYGENYGAPDCGVPLNGVHYLPVRQPVDLELWPMAYDAGASAFTTIGNYRQSGSDVEYAGQVYRWSKHHEWERFVELPRRVPGRPFELCLKVDRPDDRALLESHGWRLRSPLPMSLDVFGAYPEYIRRSRAELTVAKDQNVRLRSGWFSERAACYLASGKPVVTQETGFSPILPTGEGLFAFSTLDEAVEAVEAVDRDYRRHALAARRVAEEWFDAARVGRGLLQRAGLT
jgi:hypothetical protein